MDNDPRPKLEVTGKIGDVVTLVAAGPILDRLYSRDMKVNAACSAGGVTIEVNVTQLFAETGNALKNVPWRPLVTLKVTPRRSRARVESTWRIHLVGVGELARAQTLGFPALNYPVSVAVTLAANRTGNARER